MTGYDYKGRVTHIVIECDRKMKFDAGFEIVAKGYNATGSIMDETFYDRGNILDFIKDALRAYYDSADHAITVTVMDV